MSQTASKDNTGSLEPAADGVSGERADREHAIRQAVAAGDLRAAASSAIVLYGPELQRFLHVRLRSPERADEAFSHVCEDLWTGLASFAWRSSLRTWLYTLARHAACRMHNAARRDHYRQARLEDPDFRQQCERVRTSTAPFIKTQTKHDVRQLREQLDDDQQTLLVLRVDRGLSYRELAVIMNEVGADASEAELTRASARVRTRYGAAKRRLRELATSSGLLTRTSRP